MSEPIPGQPGRPHDYVVTPEGTLKHKRWLNPDGSRKEGAELAKEEMKVKLEVIARELLALCKAI